MSCSLREKNKSGLEGSEASFRVSVVLDEHAWGLGRSSVAGARSSKQGGWAGRP